MLRNGSWVSHGDLQVRVAPDICVFLVCNMVFRQQLRALE